MDHYSGQLEQTNLVVGSVDHSGGAKHPVSHPHLVSCDLNIRIRTPEAVIQITVSLEVL